MEYLRSRAILKNHPKSRNCLFFKNSLLYTMIFAKNLTTLQKVIKISQSRAILEKKIPQICTYNVNNMLHVYMYIICTYVFYVTCTHLRDFLTSIFYTYLMCDKNPKNKMYPVSHCGKLGCKKKPHQWRDNVSHERAPRACPFSHYEVAKNLRI